MFVQSSCARRRKEGLRNWRCEYEMHTRQVEHTPSQLGSVVDCVNICVYGTERISVYVNMCVVYRVYIA